MNRVPYLDIAPHLDGYHVISVYGDKMAGQFEVLGDFPTLSEAGTALRAAEKAATELRLLGARRPA